MMPATGVIISNTGCRLSRSRQCQSRGAQLSKQQGDLTGRQRLAVQVSLDFSAAFAIQAMPLILGLDSLGGSRYSEADPEPHDGADDRQAFFVREQVLDQRLIDLELVEFEVAQVADAGIAGTEVVQRYPDSKLLQLIENSDVMIGSFQQNRFGDLQL